MTGRPTNDQVDYRLYSDGGSMATPMFEADGKTPVLNSVGGPMFYSNPSRVGLTWGWVLTNNTDDMEILRGGGHLLVPITVEGVVWPAKTDLAEFWAGMMGLEEVARQFPFSRIEYLTDNKLTIQRMFEGVPCRSLPPQIVTRAAVARGQFRRIWPTHLNGHPTREHIARGTGHSGRPVSRWNDIADSICGHAKVGAWREVNARAAQVKAAHDDDGITEAAEDNSVDPAYRPTPDVHQLQHAHGRPDPGRVVRDTGGASGSARDWW